MTTSIIGRPRPPPRRTSNGTLIREEPRELLGVVLFAIASSKTWVKREISAQITAVPGDWHPCSPAPSATVLPLPIPGVAGLLIHEQASRLVEKPFWKALNQGRKPTSLGAAPALAGDYAGLSHAIVVGISELEQRSTADTNQAAPVMTA